MQHAILDELLSDTRAVVERLLDEAPTPASELLASLDAFDRDLLKAAEHPLVDAPTATALSAGCRALLARTQNDPDQLRLAQVAIRYLVMDDDADSDTDSPFGFDDDVEVFNAVCEQLRLPDLLFEGYS